MNESSSSLNSKNSISISLSAGPEGEKFVSSSLGEHSKAAVTHPRRLFGQSNQLFLSDQRESGFSMRGRNRGHEFQNQKYSNRHHHDWNSSPGFNARVINSQHQLYGFTNGPSEFRSQRLLCHMVLSGYDGDPYFPDTYIPSLYCASVPPPVPQPVPAPLHSPHEEVMKRSPLYRQLHNH